MAWGQARAAGSGQHEVEALSRSANQGMTEIAEQEDHEYLRIIARIGSLSA